MLMASFILRKPGGRQSKHLNACRRAIEVLVLLLAQVGVFCLPSSAQGHSEIPKSIAKFAQRSIWKSPKSRLRNSHDVCFYVRFCLPPGLRRQFQCFPSFFVLWILSVFRCLARLSPRSPVAVDIISGLADALRLKAAGCIGSPDFRELKDQLLRGE